MAQPRILILGAPGAGKGTQSAKITDEFAVDHITTGDALETTKEMDISELDTEYDTPGEYMDRGELVPDEVANAIVDEAPLAGRRLCSRRLSAERRTGRGTRGHDRPQRRPSLEVGEEELVHRLTGPPHGSRNGRHLPRRVQPAGGSRRRGAPRAARRRHRGDRAGRLSVFHENTEPVIEYYEAEGVLERVDGEQAPDEVWADVKATIEDTA